MKNRSIIGRVVRARPALHRAYHDALKFLDNPVDEARVWWDYLRTWWELLSIRKNAPKGSSRPVLILSLTEWVYQLKLDAMFGLALKMRGLQPVALLDGRALSGRAIRYFRSFGITDFVYLEDFPLTEAEKQECAVEAVNFLENISTFQQVKEWTYLGSWIGPQILSTVCREQFVGAPDPTDPTVRRKIEEILPLTLCRLRQAQKIVAALDPVLALACEVNYVHYGPFVDMIIAHGVDVLQYVQPWEDDAYMIKRRNKETRRLHPSSVSKATFENICDYPWTDEQEGALSDVFLDRYGGRWFQQSQNQPETTMKERDHILEEMGFGEDKKIAIVFCPVLWDANMFFGEDIFEDFGEWFIETVKAAVDNPAVNWIIKLHPANIWKREIAGAQGAFTEEELIERHVGRLPPHVRLVNPETNISTFSLFQIADYGVTVRGTCGMELPCFGVPTLTAGTGRYSGLGFTVDSRNREEYLARLGRIQNVELMTEEEILLAKRHAYTVFCRRPWKMKSFRGVFERLKKEGAPLNYNLRTAVKSLRELEDNGDLWNFASWAIDSDAVDYLIAGPVENDGG